MGYLESIILGLIQGLGEFLPISSSGHLILVRWLFGWEDQGLTFDVALHFGTTIALVGYFWRDWLKLAQTGLQMRPRDLLTPLSSDKALVSFLILGTIPTAIIGVLLEKKAETIFRDPLVVAFMLALMGVVLWLVDKYGKRGRTEGTVTWRDAFLMGIAQGLAVIPGTSRSGITITMALLLGFSRRSAAQLSFFLSLPIIVGACVLKLRHLTASEMDGHLLVAVFTSALSGYLAIGGLIKFVKTRSYLAFAIYRVALAGAIVFLYTRR